MTVSDPASTIRRLRDLLEEMPEVRIALLFGSAAAGRLTPKSDVDLAVALDGLIDLEARVELARRLGAATGREVDLVDLHAATGTLLKRALTTGEMLLCRDRALYARLLQRLWYEQADWMPLYKRILDARRERFLRG